MTRVFACFEAGGEAPIVAHDVMVTSDPPGPRALARQIQRDLRWRALAEQFSVGARPDLEHARPGCLAGSLGLPVWAWIVWAALAAVVFTALARASCGCPRSRRSPPWSFGHGSQYRRGRSCSGPTRRRCPASRAALEAGAREMRALPTDPYRDQACEWVGGDPLTAERPWTELTTSARTAAALRRRALSAGEPPAPRRGARTPSSAVPRDMV